MSEILSGKYCLYNYNNAIDILNGSCLDEWKEVLTALDKFDISVADIKSPGGNKSPIPQKLDELLFPADWKEARISGTLNVNIEERSKRKGKYKSVSDLKIESYIDGHNIDFIKGKVAFDVEWNSKDQTFDRDLLAMRTYYDCGLISVGIILTREEELNKVFETLYHTTKNGVVSISKKYGASTTWMGKLIPRLDSRRNGGCPILAIGIKQKCIVDWYDGYVDENKGVVISEDEDDSDE